VPTLFVTCCISSAWIAAAQIAASQTPNDEQAAATAGIEDFRMVLSVGEGSNPNGPAPAPALAPKQNASTASAPAPAPYEPVSISLASEASAAAHMTKEGTEGYSARLLWRQSKSIPWRFGGAAAAITATGVANWNWGSSPFRFQSEGWFGKDTHNLGMDKLGHAWSSYVLTEFFTDGIDESHGDPVTKSYSAAILAMGLMTYIEVFDGFSKDHGFSNEDLAVDAAGALFSVARRTVPGLREKVDFRLLYKPDRSTLRALSCFPEPHCEKDGKTARSPITDYTNQRYLLAVKLSGFAKIRTTPLRLLELHAGYYARGYTKEEEDRGERLRRRLFLGAGINIGELLFRRRSTGFEKAARSALEYIQMPYTAIYTD
jgi:hypothetical protein